MNSSGGSISGCKALNLEARNALGKCCMLSVIYHSMIYHASPFPWMTSPSSNIGTNIWKKVEKHMACIHWQIASAESMPFHLPSQPMLGVNHSNQVPLLCHMEAELTALTEI